MQLTPEFQKPYVEKTFELLPPGTYPFTVVKAGLHTSQKGKHSIELQLSFVKNDDFSFKVTVFDYLTAEPAWKFRGFLRAVGLEELEQHPTIEPYQLMGASGMAKLRIDKNEQYRERNTVQYYKVKKGIAKAAPIQSTQTQTQQQKEDVFISQAEAQPDDDCPFELDK